jgi:hypothetical protein
MRQHAAKQRGREDNKENFGCFANVKSAFVPKLNLGFVPGAEPSSREQWTPHRHNNVKRAGFRRSSRAEECSVSSQSSVESGNDFSTHADHMDDDELKSILRRQYRKVCARQLQNFRKIIKLFHAPARLRAQSPFSMHRYVHLYRYRSYSLSCPPSARLLRVTITGLTALIVSH